MQSSEIGAVDPLSHILSLLKPRNAYTAGLDAGGDWSIQFQAFEGIKFNAMTRGHCWVLMEGLPEPIRIDEGACFLLTQGRPFVLASNPALAPADASEIYDRSTEGIAVCNGGGDSLLVGGRFDFEAGFADALFKALPPVIRVRANTGEATVLRWALERLSTELLNDRPGGLLVSEHLAHIMLVEVLRLFLEMRANLDAGWLNAVADRQIGRAVGAMHADLGARWTLPNLARIAGMSRSAFAQRFKKTTGVSPLAYLMQWRMLVASDRLRVRDATISSVALSLGYESPGAFSAAFRKVMAMSPSQYRRR